MSELNAEELLALGRLAGYSRSDAARLILDASDPTVPGDECPLCERGFVVLDDGDEDNCSCLCHHINHDADAGLPGHAWQGCTRCALSAHELRAEEPANHD